MINLVYLSSSTRLMQTDELADLLSQSRENNARLDITGMLAYKEGNFIQALEGPEAAVTSLFTKIEQDPRHTGVLRLIKDRIEARQFASWSMAFENVDLLTEAEREAISPFVREPFSENYFGPNSDKAQKLLLSFRKGLR